MYNILTIFKRETATYFATPLAYIFIVIFLMMAASFTFFLGSFLIRDQADLNSFFLFHPWLYIVFIPAVSMRLWSEEMQTGTIELLLSLPVTITQAVIGKFLAAWAFIGVALGLTFPIWITVNYLGSPDNGTILAGYIGSLLMAAGYLAIGSFVSGMTKNQVIAFIISTASCFAITASGSPLILTFFSGWAPDVALSFIESLSFLTHYQDIMKGVVDLRDIVYFASLIMLFLFLTKLAIRRAKDV